MLGFKLIHVGKGAPGSPSQIDIFWFSLKALENVEKNNITESACKLKVDNTNNIKKY